MRKRVCLLLVLVYVLQLAVACNQVESPITADEVDYNSYITARGALACTEDAYYVFEDSQLSFYDPAFKSSRMMLCSRADCQHMSSDCTSFLEAYSVFGWRDRLYYLLNEDGELALWSMAADGTDRMRLGMLDVDLGDGFTWLPSIGNGHIILVIERWEAADEEEATMAYYFSLKSPEESPVILFDSTKDQGVEAACTPWLFTEWVFYEIMYSNGWELWGYHPASGEQKRVLADWEPMDRLSLKGQTLYYFDYSEGSLGSVELETLEITQYRDDLPIDRFPWGAYDDCYFFQYALSTGECPMEEQVLIVYDLQGNELQRLDLASAGLDVSLCYAFSTPEYVLFRAANGSGTYAPICYLKKNKVEQGDADFVLINGEVY